MADLTAWIEIDILLGQSTLRLNKLPHIQGCYEHIFLSSIGYELIQKKSTWKSFRCSYNIVLTTRIYYRIVLH